MSSIVFRLGNLIDNHNGEVTRLHSCSGVLCIGFDFKNDYRGNFFVFNPTSNQHQLIPRLMPAEKNVMQVMNPAFDPVKSDDYKLICVFGDDKIGEVQFFVYSSEIGAWRDTEQTLDMVNKHYYFQKGVLWNGDLHWVSEYGTTSCFDLDYDCLRPVMPEFPMPHDDCLEICYFGESGGSLLYIGLHMPKITELKVFALEMDYSKLIQKYLIDISSLNILYSSSFRVDYDLSEQKEIDFHIPFLLENRREKIVILVLSIKGKIISFETNSMTVKELAEVQPRELYFSWRDVSRYIWREAYQHIETLASV